MKSPVLGLHSCGGHIGNGASVPKITASTRTHFHLKTQTFLLRFHLASTRRRWTRWFVLKHFVVFSSRIHTETMNTVIRFQQKRKHLKTLYKVGRFENATLSFSSGQVENGIWENGICQVKVSYISSCLRHACPLFNMAAKTVQQLTVHLLYLIGFQCRINFTCGM